MKTMNQNRTPLGERGVPLPFTQLKLYWNLLDADVRYVGFQEDYYDGPIYWFGFWFGHVYLMYG